MASVNSTGTVTGNTAGTAVITYSVSNSCGTSSQYQTVTVNTIPSVSAIAGPSSVCPGATISLSDATTGGLWSTSSVSTASVNAATGVVTGVAAGTATITYGVTSVCGSGTATATIVVNPLPNSGVVSGRTTMCVGDTTSLSASVTGGVWTSSISSVALVSATGLVTAIGTGSVNIIYSVTNVCGTASSAQTITVNSAGTAGTIGGPSSLCRGSVVVLSSTVSGGTWRSADTRIAVVSPTGAVSGVAAGIVTISYTVTNICGSTTATYDVQVDVAVTNADLRGNDTVCLGDTVVYSSAVSRGLWHNTNGKVNISAGGTATAVAAGLDTLVYTVTNACGTSFATKVVRVLAEGQCRTSVSGAPITVTEISIAPNPSNGNFTVVAPVSTSEYGISITDMTGKLVYQNQAANTTGQMSITTTGLADGHYIVTVSHQGNMYRYMIAIMQ
ncbi:MAG: T9SS C-terminal target domain-containing protein [Chitinophagia bacterium]|nr:T9SS C-terminal target domain-containing protein [Chitinophagia bacterium]